MLIAVVLEAGPAFLQTSDKHEDGARFDNRKVTDVAELYSVGANAEDPRPQRPHMTPHMIACPITVPRVGPRPNPLCQELPLHL